MKMWGFRPIGDTWSCGSSEKGENMRLILSSAGLENEVLKSQFLMLLDKDVKDVHPLFIPTAAIDPGAIAVLPKCMNDLL